MKSPLVDILRQAQSETVAADEVQTVDEFLGANANDRPQPVLGSGDELSIQEHDHDRSGPGESPDSQSPEEGNAAAVNDRSSEFADSMSKTADPEQAVSPACATPITHSLIDRVGRLVPVICLVSLTTAAAGYMMLTRVVPVNLNADPAVGGHRSNVNSLSLSVAGNAENRAGRVLSIVEEVTLQRPVNEAGSVAQAKETNLRGRLQATDTPERVPEVRAPARGESQEMLRAGAVYDPDTFALLQAAYAAYRNGDLALAEKQYMQILRREAFQVDALLGVAAVHRQSQQTELALSAYRDVLSADPENVIAASAIISLQAADADWDAETELKLWLQRFPESHHLHYELGNHFARKGQWANARFQFAAAQRLWPDNPDYNFNLAVATERLGDPDVAMAYYELALSGESASASFDRQAVSAHLVESGYVTGKQL